MATSTIKQLPKTIKYYTANVDLTFNNKAYADSIDIESLTGNVVTRNNVKGVVVNGIGYALYAALTSNKYQVTCFTTEVITKTVSSIWILFYE